MDWIATRRKSGGRFAYNSIITSSVITLIPHIHHLCVAPFPFSSLRGRLVRGNPGFGIVGHLCGITIIKKPPQWADFFTLKNVFAHPVCLYSKFVQSVFKFS